jgi:linoleate 8R-lipoxygenase/9,12-octadecadienoate 8-hydroperoxide 8R-isomerase
MRLESTPRVNLADGSVGNIAIVNFFARLFNFPLKTAETPGGLLTQEELFEILGAIFTFLFFNGDEGSGLKLKSATVSAYAQVSQLVKLKVEEIKLLGKLDEAVDDLKNPKGFLHLYGDNLIRRMLKDGNSVDEVVTQILLTSTGVINLSPQVRFPYSFEC